MDCVVVIGTALETSYASRIVSHALSKKITIVEVNTEPVIEWGDTLVFKGKAEDFIPAFCKGLLKTEVLKEVIKPEEKIRKTSDSNISVKSYSTSATSTSKTSERMKSPARVMNSKSTKAPVPNNKEIPKRTATKAKTVATTTTKSLKK
jgi:hypothetical protein